MASGRGHWYPDLYKALDFMLCMPYHYCAIWLQPGCIVVVPVPMVRLPDFPHVCPMALSYGLPPLSCQWKPN